MKKIILSLGLVLATVLCARAQVSGAYELRSKLTDLPYGTTNSFVVDTSYSSSMALQVAFAGLGANTTTANIGITNAANGTNGQTFSVALAGVTNVFMWTNSPVSSNAVLSSSYTNMTIGVTNAANLTNGAQLLIVRNGNTNTFNWASVPALSTDIQSNSTAAIAGTNLFLTLGGTFPLVSVGAGGIVTVQFNPGDTVSASFSPANWGTNGLTGTYAVTNYVTTNSLQLLVTNSAAQMATNLFNALAADYNGVIFPNLIVTMTSPTNVQLVTPFNPGLSVAVSGTWSTNSIVTNAIAGSVSFIASNSLDQVTWFSDSTKNFSVAYSSTTAVGCLSNWTSLGGIGWEKFTAQNASTNYAIPYGLQVKSAVKKGF